MMIISATAIAAKRFCLMKKFTSVSARVLLLAAIALPGTTAMASAPQVFSTDNNLPPLAGAYVSPAQWHVAYAQGIIIRGVQHDRFTQNLPVPPAATTQTHAFGSALSFEISTDNGLNYNPATGPANVSVVVTHTTDDPDGTSHYDTEMTALNLTATVGASTFLVRESPTLPSKGKTTMKAVPGGFMVSSFFDIFTELSTDGGQTWLPAQQAAHVELRKGSSQVPPVSAPTPLLPPPNGAYVSPQQWHALYANGIVISNVTHKIFTDSHPPPPAGGTEQHSFNSVLQMQVSTDSGNTFHTVLAPATVQVQVASLGASANGLYDTEMLMLQGTIQDPSLPLSIRFRESPTLQSLGQTKITPQPDGTYRISSFFDIFTEVSLDGGQTWSASLTGPGHVELQDPAPEQATTSPGVPPFGGEYVSPDLWHVLYQNGIIISNVAHLGFTNNPPKLPPPGQTEVHNFGSQVAMDVLQSGQPPVHVVVPAAVSVQIAHVMDYGTTSFFDTEMLQLDLQGNVPGLPQGVMIRESPSKASLGRTSLRPDPATGGYMLSSFFDVFTELSLDGGATWSPSLSGPSTVHVRMPPPTPVVVVCPVDMTVPAAGPGGAVVTFTPNAGGGCGGAVSVIANPPSGSLFPIGTTTVTVVAKDPCGNVARCLFTVTVTQPAVQVPEYFFNQPGLPPLNGVYISPVQWHALYANGIVIRNVRHRGFLQNFNPPPIGSTSVHSFNSTLDFEVSTTGPLGTFQAASGSADVTVRVTRSLDSSGKSFFDTEMLALNLTSGTLMIRESPTLASHGQTTVRPVPGGYMISSFFDVFTELSTDGGQSWLPADQAGHVELRPDTKLVDPVTEPTGLIPPPNDQYVSPALWHILYAQGIVIKDVRHYFFTGSFLPPPQGPPTHDFNSLLDMQVSTDGGQTFSPVQVAVPTQVTITNPFPWLGSTAGGTFDTEMTLLGGPTGFSVTGNIRVRESPTEPSRGQTEIDPQADGTFRVTSFFDIFTEISTDGGATWHSPSNGPVRMQLSPLAPEQGVNTPNVPPPGEYISPDNWHAYFAQGIIISNVSHQIFLSQNPLPISGSVTDTFDSQLTMDVILPGQLPQHVILTAPCSARISSTAKDTGGVRFFDTEMLSLDVAGLPNGMMLRESPTKQSVGRLSSRPDPNNPGQYRVSSFFDIFTELSTDGGQTWSPATNGPPVMRLRSPIGVAAVTIACPPDIYTTAAVAAGAVVSYPTPTASGGCSPPTVTCTPPSGSVFPIGTTTVTCVAQDSCGNKAICTFHVIVRPPVNKRVFPTNNLPPVNGQYVSPQKWHTLFASGIILTNASHKRFVGSQPPPGPSKAAVENFGSQVEFDLIRPGQPLVHVVVPNVPVSVLVSNTASSASDQVYATEMLQLDIQGGTLPTGIRVRESPTKASTGEVRIQPTTGGYMISSFFDVWTEISLDGGGTWEAAPAPAHMELQQDTSGLAHPNPTDVHLQNRNLVLTVPTYLGFYYFIDGKDNLGDPDWFTVGGGVGTGSNATQIDFYSSGVKQRFYRVRMEEVTIPTAPAP